MKFVITTLLIISFFQNIVAQEKIYLDLSSNEINPTEFLEKWRDKTNSLSRWDYIGKDQKRYCTLKQDLYLVAVYNYELIKNQIESIIESKIENEVTILLEYTFKDDLCTINQDNKWSKFEINNRKKFLNPLRKKIEEDKKIIYIHLFEKGIILKNNSKKNDEFFFMDKGNFFRKKNFKSPALCGSFALFKPNDEILIRNGEYRLDYMVENLKSKNWKLFFDSED